MKLSLTSPHTKGPEVTKLQEALKIRKWLQGLVDGEFGPDTARAVYRGKYWLGYRKPDQRAGDLFMSYLTGEKKPTPLMKTRIANRKRIAKNKPVRLKMWEEAQKWIGTKESPFGSNRVKFSLWYGVIGPWCAMFVTWCATVAKSRAFRRGKNYAYCPYIVDDARAGRNYLTITYFPQTGNLALFDWDNDGKADHIEFFGNWTRIPGQFTTVGGNTGHSNASNGGEVLPMTRNKSDVICFVNVGK